MSAVANPESGLDADERIAIVDESTNEVTGSARRAEMVGEESLRLNALCGCVCQHGVMVGMCLFAYTAYRKCGIMKGSHDPRVPDGPGVYLCVQEKEGRCCMFHLYASFSTWTPDADHHSKGCLQRRNLPLRP